MSNLKIALHYRGRCLSVIPLTPRGKNPLINWKAYQSTLPTNDEIRAWFEATPNANVGIATGVVSGVFVLDCDSKDAVRSVEMRGYGQASIVETGNGVHFYYAMPNFAVGNRAKVAPGMDIRGTGGYVVAPPSIHPSGRAYQWLTDVNLDRRAPDWLLDLLRPGGPALCTTCAAQPLQVRYGRGFARAAFEREYRAVLNAPHGARNDTLNRSCFILGGLIGDGLLDRSEVEAAMLQAALAHGENEREARATIASGVGDGIAKPRSMRRLEHGLR